MQKIQPTGNAKLGQSAKFLFKFSLDFCVHIWANFIAHRSELDFELHYRGPLTSLLYLNPSDGCCRIFLECEKNSGCLAYTWQNSDIDLCILLNDIRPGNGYILWGKLVLFLIGPSPLLRQETEVHNLRDTSRYLLFNLFFTKCVFFCLF